MMSEAPQIDTSRLVLQAVRVEDAADIYAYVQNPNVLRYTTGITPRAFAETEAFIRGIANKPKGAYAWAIRSKEDAAAKRARGGGGVTARRRRSCPLPSAPGAVA